MCLLSGKIRIMKIKMSASFVAGLKNVSNIVWSKSLSAVIEKQKYTLMQFFLFYFMTFKSNEVDVSFFPFLSRMLSNMISSLLFLAFSSF